MKSKIIKETIYNFNGQKQFVLYQSSDCLSVTSDTLALIDFIQCNLKDKNILDVGTGIGVIPILLSEKTKAHITGIEIDSNSSNLAIKTVSENKLDNQITILNQDVKLYAQNMEPNYFDIIVSNPPYYEQISGYFNQKESLTIARHEKTLLVEDIFRISKKLLKNKGKLVLVFTAERFVEILNLFQKYHFSIKRLQFIHGGYEKKAKTFLIEGTKNGNKGLEISSPILLNQEKKE